MKKTIIILSLLASMSFVSQPALSHTTSTSYINIDLTQKTISGVWQVTLQDIHLVLGLDINSDSRLIWSEIISQQASIFSELKRSITFSSSSLACNIAGEKIMIDRRVSNVYLNIPFETSCLTNENFNVDYQFLFEKDAFHKAILSIVNKSNTSVNILSYTNRNYSYDQLDSDTGNEFLEFIVQGIIHVLIGLDHVLFVICLLLSASLLINYNQNPNKENKLKPLLNNTFKLVTTFTIAHSITLILASTKVLTIPPSIIEPVIAFSVIILALLNFFTKKNIKHWPIVFAFGLIHGFGFAFVLEEVSLESGTLMTTLFGFNLGVEIGQLIIVACVLPILYLLNSKKYYHRIIIPVSSLLIASIGLIWFIERTSNFSII